MILEKDSNIQFDIDFEISDLKNFNSAIIQAIKEKQKDFKYKNIEKEIETGIGIRTLRFVFYSIFLNFSIYTFNIEFLRNDLEETKKEMLKDLEFENSLDKKELIKHGISLLDKEFKAFEGKIENPKGNVKLKFEAQDIIDEIDFQKAIINNSEQYVLDLINNLISTEFEVNLYGSFYFNKNKYSLIQDFGLREKIEVQKDIREKIGQLYLKKINFIIEDSPIGISSLEIGELDKEYNIRIEINFKTKKIINLVEKFDLLKNMIKTFIQKVD